MSFLSVRQRFYKEDENGKKLEPMEHAVIDVPDEFAESLLKN